jgi:hypothetical protein
MNADDMDVPAENDRVAPLDALRGFKEDIDVPESATVRLGGEDRAFSRHLRLINVASYDDLRLLGLVPRDHDEAKVRSAIAEDDEIAVRIALDRVDPCDCARHDESSRRRSASEVFTAAFNRVRALNHPSLSHLLSAGHSKRFPLDTQAGLTRMWVSRLDEGMLRAGLLALMAQDITIRKDARLFTPTKLKVMFANNIFIHKSGSLISQGNYLSIQCNSIQRFSIFSQWVTEIVKIQPTWHAYAMARNGEKG